MLFYVTGNRSKFQNAKNLMSEFGVNIEQSAVKIHEIQSDSIEEVAQDKARQAFDQLRQPLFVNDAGWIIPALGGFPGPYMKFINQWFTSQDFLSLMQDRNDRTIILREYIVYVDENTTKTFTQDVVGKVLTEIKGSGKAPSDSVISLSQDGKSIAEENAAHQNQFFLESEKAMWQEFANWLKESKKTPS